MKQLLMRAFAIFLTTVALACVCFGQTNRAAVNNESNSDTSQKELLLEVRLARQAIEQLRKQLVQLEVATIQIRLQQDVVVNKEAQLESVRSEAQLTEDALVQLRDRVAKLEAADSSRQEEEEQQRNRAELQDAKKEIERQQQKLDLLRSQDTQLVGEFQAEKTRLSEMIAHMETLGSETLNGRSSRRPNPSDPNGPPNN